MDSLSQEKPLKILVVTQYFWPENMRINNMVEGFVAKGHEVTVLTGVPNYPEGQVFADFRRDPAQFSNYRGARVIRVPMLARGKSNFRLAMNYFSFFSSASIIGSYKLRGQAFDSIFVYGVSPIMGAIPALLLGRLKRAPVLIWVLDLWPESLRAVGVIENPKLLGLVGKVVSWIYNRTDYLLLQSRSFDENVKEYCTRAIDADRLVYFPSWAEDDFSADLQGPSELLQRDDAVFTILFAGNIGDAQDFPAIMAAVKAVETDLPVRWVIVGDGRASQWLTEHVAQNRMDNVLLLGRHPLEKMPALFAVADALLVSLRTNDVFEKTIPGKVQAYLASGKPVIAMIDGEAANVVEGSGAGMVCGSGDAQGLARIVRTMGVLPRSELERMGLLGRRYYLEHFSKDTLFDRLEALFRKATLRRNEQ
ncbi:glycosyltransferase family 4 protein [Pseudomonas allii]|uniref:Glycosyltransferase family 4 protein n=2 Tax=Pseudomonas allii TaxID=2740531 RepID=A0ACC6L6K9_9PSED|nr:glycosyltransferase family 4 protein [Pseudomonas allii]MDR9874049.1 glycosyltransferase family 4 protein [Pseudomonas allii]NWN48303.1 glycosyltransferase family 4 protein [Pseudomonas allii]NWN61695.1 glycosyltransferase family 4 protein [Pseudomonas allii]